MCAEKKPMTAVTREYTINIHKSIHKVAFKRRARYAVEAVRQFAKKAMGTEDVRIDTTLNKYIWSNGIRNVPRRIRVRLSRRPTSEEEEGKFYTFCEVVEVPTFKGLLNTTVNNA